MSITRKLSIGIITATLSLGGVGVATAQSSFDNLSSSSAAPSQPLPQPGPEHDPEIAVSDGERLQISMEGYLLRVGNRITPTATAIAQEYADEGAAGNVNFWGNSMRSLWEPRGIGTITRVPESLIDDVIVELDGSDGEVNVSLRAGAAVSYADGIYYMVEFYA